MNDMVETGAIFSSCERYRYTLSRIWVPDLPVVMFVGLNPSTADAQRNDPTVRRCIGFARDWGFGGMYMMNIFAFRATDPADLLKVDEPVGQENDYYLAHSQESAALVVAAWGNHGRHLDRAAAVLPRLNQPHYLRRNRSGEPSHPLYLPARLTPMPF